MLHGATLRIGPGDHGQVVPEDGHQPTGAGRMRIGHGFLALASGMRIHGIGGMVGENHRLDIAKNKRRQRRSIPVVAWMKPEKKKVCLQAGCNQCLRRWTAMRRSALKGR